MATYRFLDLASELVFVGDEGTTEASGRSRREGIEVGAKVRLLDWLTCNGSFTYTIKAELVDTRQAIALASTTHSGRPRAGPARPRSPRR